MTTVARLKVLMEADSHRLTSALSNVKKQVFNVRNAFTVLAGAGGIGAMVSSQLRAADDMQKFSKRIGVSVEALSELRHAAQLSGIEVNQLQTGMQRMVRRLSEVATTGKGTAASALERLGLDAKKLKDLAPDQQLAAIADAMVKVETQSEKVELAFKLFDTEGVGMLQMMEEGSAGIDKMRGKLRELGGTLTTEGAAKAAAARDAFANLSAGINAVIQSFAVGLAPEITSALEWIVGVMPKLLAGFKTVGKVIGAIAATAAAIFRGDFAGAAAIGSINVGDIYRETLGEGSGETEKNTKKTADKMDEMVGLMRGLGVAG